MKHTTDLHTTDLHHEPTTLATAQLRRAVFAGNSREELQREIATLLEAYARTGNPDLLDRARLLSEAAGWCM